MKTIYIYLFIYIKRRLLAHGDCCKVSNCRKKILATFRGIFLIFSGISKFLRIYPAFSLGTPNDVLWNPV
jgi:hypothetical protein